MIDGDLSTYGIVYFDAYWGWGTVNIEIPGFDKVKYNGIEIHAGFDLQGVRVNLAHAGEICGICSPGRECSLKCSYYPVKGNLTVELRKYILKSQTQWIIYEVKVRKPLLSSGEIAGTVVGAVCAVLLIICLVKARVFMYKRGFYRALREGYVSANSRGERSGQFLIPHGHPSKYVRDSIFRDWCGNGDDYEVIFSIRSPDGGYAYKNGYKQRCLVTFRIAGDAENAANHTDNARENAVNAIGTANDEEIVENTESADNAVEPTAPPSTSEIMNLPPPTYPVSNAGRSNNFDRIPTYEEVMANSEYFPGAKE